MSRDECISCKHVFHDEDFITTRLCKKCTKNDIEMTIDNFIIFWTSDDKEREQMREHLKLYMDAECD